MEASHVGAAGEVLCLDEAQDGEGLFLGSVELDWALKDDLGPIVVEEAAGCHDRCRRLGGRDGHDR